MKRKACAEQGITLIEIPYWWDKSKASVIASIIKVRPELESQMSTDVRPIDANATV